MPEVEQVGGGHGLIQFQPLGDRIQLVLQLTHRDGGLQSELHIGRQFAGLDALLQRLHIRLARVGLQRIQIAEPENKALARCLRHGCKWHRQLIFGPDLNAGAQALTVLQFAVGIGKHRFDQQPLSFRIDAGINGSNRTGGNDLVAAGSTQQHGLPPLQPSREDGRHLNTSFQLIVLNQAGEHLALLNHIPHLHLHVRHRSSGRRTEIAVAEVGFRHLHLLHRSDVLGAVAIQFLLRCGPGLCEVEVPVVIRLGIFGLGFVLIQAGLLLGLVQDHQQLPGGDFITLADLERENPTRRLGGQLHQIAGLQGAHRIDAFGELRHPGHRGLHLRRRWLLRGLTTAGTQGDQCGERSDQAQRETHMS